jgi:hypothetical protein
MLLGLSCALCHVETYMPLIRTKCVFVLLNSATPSRPVSTASLLCLGTSHTQTGLSVVWVLSDD